MLTPMVRNGRIEQVNRGAGILLLLDAHFTGNIEPCRQRLLKLHAESISMEGIMVVINLVLSRKGSQLSGVGNAVAKLRRKDARGAGWRAKARVAQFQQRSGEDLFLRADGKHKLADGRICEYKR